MKFLTKNADYAIRALMMMAAHPGQFISARQIADDQHIPYQYLRRILQQLIQEDLASSKEGGLGGFQMKADPRDISVAKILEIFRGKIQISDCLFRKKPCENRSRCVLRQRLQEIENIVAYEFARTTVANLLTKNRKKK